MGRPVAYSRSSHDRLVQALLAGNTFRDACEAAGIGWSTWCTWRRAAEDTAEGHSDDRINDLVREAREAHGRATVSLVASVAVAGKKDWRAALGLLQFRADAPKRRAEARRAHYEALVSKKRADGTLPAAKIDLNDERATEQRIAELLAKGGFVTADGGGTDGAADPLGGEGGEEG